MTFTDRVSCVLNSEAKAILSIPENTITVGLPILAKLLLECKGKVVITAMGKNGNLGQRVAATLSCTGTPSVFIDSGSSSHGDIGVLASGDILLALSNSGKTREVLETIDKVRNWYGDKIPIVVVTSRSDSPLAQLATLTLAYGEIEEPCPLGLTPSSSLAVMSALLDAVALGVMEMREFTLEDYGNRHWSGYIAHKIAQKNTYQEKVDGK